MRILGLAIEGFGPFSGRHTIDFTDFADTGVYLIGGPTGAGKSTILDAIVFALFGSVPRYEGISAKRSNLRSDFASSRTATEVELTFDIHGSTYRVRRSPEFMRPKQHGEGLTKSRASVALDVAVGKGWDTLTTGYRDAAGRIEEIVGLNAEQFQQTILLAQGRFAEFLQANSEARAEILRRLFATGRFNTLTTSVVEESREASARIERLEEEITASTKRAIAALAELDEDGERHESSTVRDTPVDAAAAITIATAVLQRGRLQADETRRQRDAAAGALGDARSLLKDIKERDEALIERNRLEEQADAITAQRDRLADAEWALELWQHVMAKDSAERERASFGESLAAAIAAAVDVAELNEEQLLRRLEELHERLASYQELFALEQSLPELRRNVASAAQDRDSAIDERDRLRERVSVIPDQLEHLQQRIEGLRADAAGLEGRELDAEEARMRFALIAELERAQKLHGVREAELRTALETKREASEYADSALQAMLDGTAARLARELIPGDPCPVCGAIEHPSPAIPDADELPPITEEAVQEARRREQAAAATCDEARAAERTALHAVETIRDQLGGADEASLLRARDDAEASLQRARKAEETLPEAQNELDDVSLELTSLRERVEVMTERINELATAHALAKSQVLSAEERIRNAVGAESVAARQSSAAAELKEVQQLIEARQRFAESQRKLEHATRTLREALDGRSESDLRAAHLERSAREEHAARIREYDAAVTRVRATLEREPIKNIAKRTADGMPDLDALEDAAEAAEQRYSGAVGAVAATEQVVAVMRREQEAADRLRRELDDMGERTQTLTRLAQSLDGKGPNTQRMRLETYVLAAGLESILEAANLRLESMTQGRYQLEHDDSGEDRGRRGGLGIAVRDDYTGATRSVQSLSGGETFLTSLALALGLADVVQAEAGGVQLDTLFVDEGFGALDSGVLELAMQTLADLQTGGRTIGVISHVPSMQERIPERIRVVRAAGGRGSTLEFP